MKRTTLVDQKRLYRGGRFPRTAAVLICTLACLLVSTSLAAVLVSSAIGQRRNVRAALQMRQTQLLLDAGVLRAARRLQSDPQYEGEIWQPSNSLDSLMQPKISIQIFDSDDDSTRRVRVTASLGNQQANNPPLNRIRSQSSHSFQYKILNPSSEE